MAGRPELSTSPLSEPLTRRERDVLALLAEDLTAPEIAERLVLGLSTVKYHLQHVYAKLEVNNKRAAVARAQALGLIGRPARPPAEAASPAAADPRQARHNLPHEVTRFFGREPELSAVRQRLSEYRIVTLVGVGGVGKTRLALRVARSVADDFGDGVWLVELAPLSSPELVAQQVASSLGIIEERGRSLDATLVDGLRSKHLLLVVDNCEHLVAACASLAQRLVSACPQLIILATSREPLGTVGEAVFPLPSLELPDPQAAARVDTIARSPAVRLFVDRARMIRATYDVTTDNMRALAGICRRLDGIPLAIEMAAARINLLSAQELEARLSDAVGFLTGGTRTALPKHQTLRATLDWSFSLLSEAERRLLRRLSIFAGGCTLEAAEAVCSGEGIEAGQVLGVLAMLVAKSMVVGDRRPGAETRYWLLEMVRQFAVEQREAAGETPRLLTRHHQYYLEYSEACAARFSFEEREQWARKLVPDRDNLRLALQSTFDDQKLPDPLDAGPRMVLATRWFGFSYQEQTEWSVRAVDWCHSHAGIAATLVARLQQAFSFTVGMDNRTIPLLWAEQAVEINRALGPAGATSLLDALRHLASINIQEFADAERGGAVLAEAKAVFESLEPAAIVGQRRRALETYFRAEEARLAILRRDYEAAKTLCAESLRLARLAGNSDVFVQLMSYGEACFLLMEYEAAEVHFLEALRSTDTSDPIYQRTSYALRWLGRNCLARGDLAQAAGYCTASLYEAQKVPDRNMIASDLGIAAQIVARAGQPVTAAHLAGASHALYARQGRTPWEDSTLDSLWPGWQASPDQARMEQAYEAGQGLQVDAAIDYAVAALADQPG